MCYGFTSCQSVKEVFIYCNDRWDRWNYSVSDRIWYSGTCTTRLIHLIKVTGTDLSVQNSVETQTARHLSLCELFFFLLLFRGYFAHLSKSMVFFSLSRVTEIKVSPSTISGPSWIVVTKTSGYPFELRLPKRLSRCWRRKLQRRSTEVRIIR